MLKDMITSEHASMRGNKQVLLKIFKELNSPSYSIYQTCSADSSKVLVDLVARSGQKETNFISDGTRFKQKTNQLMLDILKATLRQKAFF